VDVWMCSVDVWMCSVDVWMCSVDVWVCSVDVWMCSVDVCLYSVDVWMCGSARLSFVWRTAYFARVTPRGSVFEVVLHFCIRVCVYKVYDLYIGGVQCPVSVSGGHV